MSVEDIQLIQSQFVQSAKLARDVGYDLLEVHCAHGYLLHSFLTNVVNTRADGYGGDLKGRARFLLETVEKVRAVWPENRVLSVRLSVHNFVVGGLTLEDTSQVGAWLKNLGVDILDCSGGGAVPEARGAIGNRTAEQPDMAGVLRSAVELPTMAVDGITDPVDAERIIAENKADIVLLGREMMRDPHWAFTAAKILGADARPQLRLYEQMEDLPHVISAWDILSGDVKASGDVLIFDEAGDHAGLQSAEIAAMSASVEVMTPDCSFAPEVMGLNLVPYITSLQDKDVQITVARRLMGVRKEGNRLMARIGSDYSAKRFEKPFDQIVVNYGTLPNADLYFDLKPLSINHGEVDQKALIAGHRQALAANPTGDFQLFRIGDAVAARNTHAAIYDALRLMKDL